ncbi:glycosyltransferase family 2 protein [Ramlibacter sp. USB13]|uniref:Glycosyltransferase family 2 protein n=1 Tax=Ramlibacter cellulosilyticus TaxID=2764187 RepID=A0A923MRB5_9BURK|nr:glycosyltransferase family 2 protein [Ramlibacter cellulosilyticus]MBC5782779.1 glycosyltransferase family 2 protein [Ramlibacter cellulosilyticus]
MAVVPIIIPFYKEHEKLRQCRAAIAAQTWRECETFVRDNTHDNILYTAAVNEGLAKYCYRPDVDYVVVLNQDAYMDPECVQRLVAFMEATPDCGIACPVQYQHSASTGQKQVTWGGSLRAWPTGVHRCDPFESYRDPFETYWANGACMMIRTRVVREIGQFDANMRFICSDSDFAFTARARGWGVYVVPQALCRHSLGASGSPTNDFINLVKLRDAVYFTEKWLTGGLYRALALEGPELTGPWIRQVLRKYKWNVTAMERKLGEHEPSPADAWPSWLTEMHIPAQEARKKGF